MTKLNFIAFDVITGKEVPIGSMLQTASGQKVTLKALTRERTPGKSGKILVEHQSGGTIEYYDKVCNLRVEIDNVDSAPVQINVLTIAEIVCKEARNLENRVRVFKSHPTFDKKSDLKADANKLTGMFSLLMRLNHYFEIEGSDVRTRVNAAREAVESLYAKKTA
jgi:hypothetical protein